MNTKLTLKLDENLIKSAKRYSSQSGKSLSNIVADFFSIIKNQKLEEEYPLTPAVKSLKGALKNASFSEDDYKKYLEEKYL